MDSLGKFFNRGRDPHTLNQPIYVNDHLANASSGFPSNEIRTTKYTMLTFVPKNLLEQFRRYQNFYFFLVCIPTVIPSISPITPASAILPFVAILLVAAVKEGWEDWKRFKQDEEFNSRKYEVYRDSLWVNILNKDIKVGDIMCLKEGEEVPADVILISSSRQDGICYFETANLDGETYLKQCSCNPELMRLDKDHLARLNGVLNVAQPNKALYKFKGTLTTGKAGVLLHNPLLGAESKQDGTVYAFDGKQLLMRGVRLRNTKTVYGLVAYTGPNTKLALNQVSTPSKFSRTEKLTNWVAVFIFIVQMVLVTSATIATAIVNSNTNHYYLYTDWEDVNFAADAGKVFASYFVLLAYFIPISLFVNLEVIKVVQAYFMSVDTEMMVDGKGATVQNSNLNDELSRVSYIFSDKTGTLTQNKMIFDSCSINGVNYKDAGQGELRSQLNDAEVTDFFRNLALNNEVLPEDHGEQMPHFAAPSPDEVALAKGGFINGVYLREREIQKITVWNGHAEEVHDLLCLMPFTSDRKRSSVITRSPTGKLTLYTKGADSIVLARLEPSNASSAAVRATKKHITEYSVRGLRTLIIARKDLTKTEYEAFADAYDKACKDIINGEMMKDKCFDLMERDLVLQGCTAIEDKLQDQVPWTIGYFISAGIKVWMITGDKQETAENIGKSCNLIQEDSTLVRVVEPKDALECKDMIQTAKKVLKTEKKVSLVIDSFSLVYALVDFRDDFLEIGQQCSSVIVCRAEPLQKAQVVSMMKKGTKKICLAVGDGANDVSMIQEAHIGVGIWGEEGSQAALNSDYSIRQFKNLGRLVTIHGRYNMLRTSLLVEYSFYKNLAMFVVQYWFAPYCKWSATTFYDDWVMAGFNTLLLAAPPLCMALFEKDLSEAVIVKFPEAYKELRDGLYFTPKSFLRWMGSALWHSIVFFFLYLLAVPDAVSGASGKTSDLVSHSTLVAAAAVITIILRGAMVTQYWVWVSHVAYWGSMILMILLFLLESAFISYFPSFYNVMPFVMSTPWFWLYFPCVAMICLIPDIVYEICQREFAPWNYQIIREATVKKSYLHLEVLTQPPGDFEDVNLGPSYHHPSNLHRDDSLVGLSTSTIGEIPQRLSGSSGSGSSYISLKT